MKSLAEIDAQNKKERAANGSAVYGITVFSDLSDEEFRSTYLGAVVPDDYTSIRRLMPIAPAVAVTETTTYADWTGIYTTPIKNQGGCGSCWLVRQQRWLHF